jgi:hypothetical protein
MKSKLITKLVYFTIIIVTLIGEVKCIIKAIDCNWEPVGKAEIIYTGAALTGFGCVVGYIDIKDK